MVDNFYSALAPGPNCITVWQFDQGYNFAKVPTSVIIEGR